MSASSVPMSDHRGSTQTLELADQASDIQKALPHFKLDIVRTGRGSGPSKLWNVDSRDSTMSSVTMGFPVLGHAYIPDDEIAVAAIRAAPKSARWSGIDLHSGMVMVLGPGAHHTALSPAGLEITYMSLRLGAIEERFGLGVDTAVAGTVAVYQSIGGGNSVAADMEAIADHAISSGSRTAMSEGVEALTGLVLHKQPAATSRRLTTGRLIVAECIRTVDAWGAATTMADLLRVTRVSPRRLRQAFDDIYGVPPSRYLHLRVISNAHKRLAAHANRCNPVTQVASDLGVAHLGRFAAQYREVFGEPPSLTAARARSLGV